MREILVRIARDPAVGTPTYVYDLSAMAAEARALMAALGEAPSLVAYAIKANSAGPVVRTLAREGCGADAVSGAEVELALACGVPAEKIVYSGVAKDDAELDLAILRGIRAIQVESLEEIGRVDARARAAGRVAKLSIRVNPAVDALEIDTHQHIRTGHDEAKFGVPVEQVLEAAARVRECKNVELVGVACHVGSQLTRVDPYVESAKALFGVAKRLREAGVPLSFVDTGGGFGIDYGAGCEAHPADFVRAARAAQREAGLSDLSLHVEPGRSLVGAHGVLVARVIQSKVVPRPNETRRWLMIDAGMNDLLRPALYQARHRIEPLEGGSGALVPYRVVGPVCESSCDFGEYELPEEAPELVVIRDCGAYGYTMASQYNGRPLPAEVFVRDGNVVAKRLRAPRNAWVEERLAIQE